MRLLEPSESSYDPVACHVPCIHAICESSRIGWPMIERTFGSDIESGIVGCTAATGRGVGGCVGIGVSGADPSALGLGVTSIVGTGVPTGSKTGVAAGAAAG